jgi:hypothetical protein
MNMQLELESLCDEQVSRRWLLLTITWTDEDETNLTPHGRPLPTIESHHCLLLLWLGCRRSTWRQNGVHHLRLLAGQGPKIGRDLRDLVIR